MHRKKATIAKLWIAIFSILLTAVLCCLAIAGYLEDHRIQELEAAGLPQGKPYNPPKVNDNGVGDRPVDCVAIDLQPDGQGYRFGIRNRSIHAIDVPLIRKEISAEKGATTQPFSVTVQPTGTGPSQFLSSWNGKDPASVEYVIEDDLGHACHWHW